MSKMFDALRKAEEERRKRQAEKAGEADLSLGSPLPERLGGLQSDLDKEERLFRELGILRNSIESALAGKDKRSLIFSSSSTGEGATTLAVNFSRLLAMHGNEKVLLCEMNARSPSFAGIFHLDGQDGLIDIFLGQKTLGSVVKPVPGIDLHVAAIGKADPSLLQLHLGKVFPKLVQSALSQFTTVIFDAPPIASSPETPAMSPFVDGIVLVIQAGKTKREVVQRSIKAINELKGNIIGVALNKKKYYIPEFLYKRV